MTVPIFTSTEQAQEFGRKASEEEIRELKLCWADNFLWTKHEHKTFGITEKAMKFATQAQFCREALEAKEKP